VMSSARVQACRDMPGHCPATHLLRDSALCRRSALDDSTPAWFHPSHYCLIIQCAVAVQQTPPVQVRRLCHRSVLLQYEYAVLFDSFPTRFGAAPSQCSGRALRRRSAVDALCSIVPVCHCGVGLGVGNHRGLIAASSVCACKPECRPLVRITMLSSFRCSSGDGVSA
jgi:hypothetical protein